MVFKFIDFVLMRFFYIDKSNVCTYYVCELCLYLYVYINWKLVYEIIENKKY